MAYDREGYAPWSLTRKAGVQSATVDGDIKVPQYIQPVLDTGFVDEKGDWKGTKSSDEQFHSFQTDEAIANNGTILTPSAVTDKAWPIDMTGYNDIFIAIKVTNGGDYKFQAVQGPDSNSFANLSPVGSANLLRMCQASSDSFSDVLDDAVEAAPADVWTIFFLQGRAKDQKLLQFKITNTSGGESTIDTAFMRLV